jgi:hypothetical protein
LIRVKASIGSPLVNEWHTESTPLSNGNDGAWMRRSWLGGNEKDLSTSIEQMGVAILKFIFEVQ